MKQKIYSFILAATLITIGSLIYIFHSTVKLENETSKTGKQKLFRIINESLTESVDKFLAGTDYFFNDSTVINCFLPKPKQVNSLSSSNLTYQFFIVNTKGVPIVWTQVRNDLLKELKGKYSNVKTIGFFVRTPETFYLVATKPVVQNKFIIGYQVVYQVIGYNNPYFPSGSVPKSIAQNIAENFDLESVPKISVRQPTNFSEKTEPLFIGRVFEDSLFVYFENNQLEKTMRDIVLESGKIIAAAIFIGFISISLLTYLLGRSLGYRRNKILIVLALIHTFFCFILYEFGLLNVFLHNDLMRNTFYLSQQSYHVFNTLPDWLIFSGFIFGLGMILLGIEPTERHDKPSGKMVYSWFLFMSLFVSVGYNFVIVILQSLLLDGFISALPFHFSIQSPVFLILLSSSAVILGLNSFVWLTYKIFYINLAKKIKINEILLLLVLSFIPFFAIQYFITSPEHREYAALIFAFIIFFGSAVFSVNRGIRWKYGNGFTHIFFLLFQGFLPLFFISIFEIDTRLSSLQQNIAVNLSNPKDGYINYLSSETINLAKNDSSLSSQFSNNESAAYDLWLNSILSSEKINSRIRLYDSQKNTVSEWSFGLIPQIEIDKDKILIDSLVRSGNGISIVSLIESDKKSLVDYNRFAIRVVSKFDSLVGFMILDIQAPKASVNFSNSVLLSVDDSHFPEFDFEVGTYKNNEIQETKVLPVFPLRLNNDILSQLQKRGKVGIESQFESKVFSIFLYRSNSNPETVIAVARPLLTLNWVWNQFAEYFLFVLIVFAILYIFTQLIGLIKYKRLRFNFRERVYSGVMLSSFFAFWLLIFFFEKSFETHGVNTSRLLLDNYFQGMIPQITDQIVQQDFKSQFSNQDYLIYKNRSVIYSSRPEWIKLNLMPEWIPAETSNLNQLSSSPVYYKEYSVRNTEFVVGYYQVPGLNFETYMVAIPNLISKRTIEGEIETAKSYLISGYVIFLLMLVGLLSIWANWLLTPIKIIEKAFGKIGRQKEPNYLNLKGIPEVEQFAQSFNGMVDDLKNYRENLTKAERQLAWQEMAKQVAHEIKNPLTPLKLNTQMLIRTHESGNPNFNDMFGKITKTLLIEIDKIDKIAKTFSTFSKMPERNLEPLDLSLIVQEVINLFAGDQAEIKLENENQQKFVLGDREEFSRVCSNLIMNSIQAKVGEIAIIEIKIQVEQDWLKVNFTDYGKGIPANLLEKVLEPNFSTKTDGMGLGLAICKKIITDMRGSFLVTSAEGKFTTVEIKLPVI